MTVTSVAWESLGRGGCNRLRREAFQFQLQRTSIRPYLSLKTKLEDGSRRMHTFIWPASSLKVHPLIRKTYFKNHFIRDAIPNSNEFFDMPTPKMIPKMLKVGHVLTFPVLGLRLLWNINARKNSNNNDEHFNDTSEWVWGKFYILVLMMLILPYSFLCTLDVKSL